MRDYEANFQIRTVGEMSIRNSTTSQTAGTGIDYHTENFTQTSFVMGNNLFISIAHYTGPAKYQPTSPFDPLKAAKRTGYTILDPESIKIDGHIGTAVVSYNTKYPDRPNIYVVSYALDLNTFVQVRASSLDYDKDVALLLETLHIEKKVK